MHTQTHQAYDIRSRQEINDLIKEWESNPNWELWTSPGFEAHQKELMTYQQKKEIEWNKARGRRDRSAARSMGLSVDLYKRFKQYKAIADHQKQEATKMMLNLVFGTTKVPKEQEVEVETLIDRLFRASINYAKAEMIQEIRL